MSNGATTTLIHWPRVLELTRGNLMNYAEGLGGRPHVSLFAGGVQGDRASTMKVAFWECKGDG